MDDFQKELNELKGFIADLKADRAGTKEKEKKEAWTKYVSLSIVIIAVIGATAAQWSGKFGSDVQMSQVKASDQWAFYQSKSIKQNLYEVSRTLLTKNVDTNSAAFKKGEDDFNSRIKRYEDEKAEIKKKAEDLEKKRDVAGVAGGHMSLSVSFFSVSIAMASICMVTKKKPLWFASLALAGLGGYQMILAWLVK
jgi:hypothetical protein